MHGQEQDQETYNVYTAGAGAPMTGAGAAKEGAGATKESTGAALEGAREENCRNRSRTLRVSRL